ncbi:MAG TPA: HD domain-containing phosphohydrolase [Acidimicrobiia bacterium]|nr:HD domain-containing phosphohydrolase [Acidimicrobiia bacterium]
MSLLIAIVAAAGAGIFGLQQEQAGTRELVVGVAAMCLAMQVKVPPRSTTYFGLGVAIAAATPVYFIRESQTDLGAILVVMGLGTALGLTWSLLRSPSGSAPSFFYQLAGMAAYVLVFAAVLPLPVVQAIDDEWKMMIPLTIGAGTWLLIVRLGTRFERHRANGVDPFNRDFIGDVNVFVSLVGTGALLALTYRRLGLWAIGVAGLPFLFAQSAFGRFLRIKRTYRQTIRALARIPEVAGLGVDGHADRTARLASEVGYDLGLGSRELEDLEYAALMHDIGRITLTEPAILRVGYTDDDIARWGAEIISEAPSLSGVAELVRKLHEPYRKPGEQSDPGIPLISKVVRAASSYDHLIVERKLSPLQAVEVLHQGAAYDFDPSVIAALRRVLERRLAFHPTQA